VNIAVDTVYYVRYASYMSMTFQKLRVLLSSGKSYAVLQNLWYMVH